MTIVLANLERLSIEPDTERRRKQMASASWGARRAAKLTDQMLSFARRQFHDDRRIDVNEALANCDSILDQIAGADISVRLDLAGQPLVASLDAGQLEMALLNLVRNAADAVPPGSDIAIATRGRRFGGPDSGDVSRSPSSIRAAGMTPDVVRRAAEPFFTTKALGKGTGLGLSMVKGFVEQSDGRLEMESIAGRGTTIRLVFPAVAAPAG